MSFLTTQWANFTTAVSDGYTTILGFSDSFVNDIPSALLVLLLFCFAVGTNIMSRQIKQLRNTEHMLRLTIKALKKELS